jgi:hypothetical protein
LLALIVSNPFKGLGEFLEVRDHTEINSLKM